MVKILHIQVLEVEHGTVAFKITRQSHIRDSFYKMGRAFQEGDVIILSAMYPEYSIRRDAMKILCVRGDGSEADDAVVLVPFGDFDEVLQAILAYNSYYTKNTLVMSDVVEGLELWENKNV